jgi:hypothetical protein
MGANPSILSDVKTVIQPYMDKPQVQGREVSVPFMENTRLPLDEYVHIMRSTIQSYQIYNVPFISSLYRLADIDTTKNFTGQIQILNYDDRNRDGKNPENKPIFKSPDGRDYRYIKFQNSNISNYIDVGNVDTMDIGHSTDIYRLFIQQIITNYRNPECKFISILLCLSYMPDDGHANMFLIVKDGLRSVKFIMYEPHGSWGTSSSTMSAYFFSKVTARYRDMKKTFLKLMTKIFNDRGVNTHIVNTGVISCPVGIQTKMEDPMGYCVTISLFWLYIFLRLINVYEGDNKDKLLTDLTEIENSVYSLTGDSDKLYSLIINFTYDFLSFFYSSYLVPEISNINPVPRLINKENYDRLKIIAPTTVSIRDGNYYSTHPNSGHTNYKHFITTFIKKYNSNIHKFKKIESTDKPKRRRKTRVQPEDTSTNVRKILGSCVEDSDCVSDKCNSDGNCDPPQDYNTGAFPTYTRENYVRSIINPDYIHAEYEDSESKSEESEDEPSRVEIISSSKKRYKYPLLARRLPE